MAKREDIQSILVIGAGPIVIGQACEFDYSGAQACKALKDEGYRVILVNSNPATIMTDPSLADSTYIEPTEWETVASIIEQERPDALLPTMGGQTALNCALDLAREGILEKFDVELIGATKEAIDKAEDREKFDRAMKNIGLETPRSSIAHSLEEALQALEQDHDFLLEGDVFTKDVIDTWIEYKTAEEADQIRLRPHSYEYFFCTTQKRSARGAIDFLGTRRSVYNPFKY